MTIERWKVLRHGERPHLYSAGNGQWFCIGLGVSDYGFSPLQAWSLWLVRAEAACK